jgi:hypothetical protein
MFNKIRFLRASWGSQGWQLCVTVIVGLGILVGVYLHFSKDNKTAELWTAFGITMAALSFNLLRNTKIEYELRHSLKAWTMTAISGSESGTPLLIIVRNRTSVPITVREIRLMRSRDSEELGVPLEYLSYSWDVAESDIVDSEYLFEKFPEHLDIEAENWPSEKSGRKRGQDAFIELQPEAGAVYMLAPSVVYSRYHDRYQGELPKYLLLFVDYPTVFGSRKVIRVDGSQELLSSVRSRISTIINTNDQEKNENKGKEIAKPQNNMSQCIQVNTARKLLAD